MRAKLWSARRQSARLNIVIGNGKSPISHSLLKLKVQFQIALSQYYSFVLAYVSRNTPNKEADPLLCISK